MSVAGAFRGQPFLNPQTVPLTQGAETEEEAFGAAYMNAALTLPDAALLANIREIQQQNHLKLSERIISHLGRCSLDVEMETGTGKTYVYIKTMYELHRQYGWSKFIVVVPSVAIREGVKKTFEMTSEHFMEQYRQKIRFFVYNSNNLEQLDAFSHDAGISAMIINMQAFNVSMKEGGRRKEARIIYDKRDEFGARRPIDVIRACSPILILDEPQKMGGDATQKALHNFHPLFCIQYSATHKEHHNLVYALDAVDAYNRRLVKRIEVKGFRIKNLKGADSYLYLDSIIVSPTNPPKARLELEVRYRKSIKREMRIIGVDDNLYELSRHMEQYKGYRLSDIDPAAGSVTFTNGEMICKGDVAGDIAEKDMRRIQIRETIISHMEKEEELFERGIKTLSLFFIDEVAKYRTYDENGEAQTGEYGRMFEEEYRDVMSHYMTGADTPYQRYLRSIEVKATHKGYFSIDKKGHCVNSDAKGNTGVSDDIYAYDLILKHKERLLSFDEPVRFIFSHSALREGWDNPNVFQICALKHSDSVTAKRQEVGRGLRLCVNQDGLRMDEGSLGRDLVHKVNRLTVVASESYQSFAADLQKQMKEVLYERPNEDSEAVLEEMIANGNKTIISENALNDNFRKKEFQALWNHINHKYAYTAHIDSDKLIQRAISHIDKELSVSSLQYSVTRARQRDVIDAAMVEKSDSFGSVISVTAHSAYLGTGQIPYDLIGKVAEGATLTRKTAAAILQGISPGKFAMFPNNPEEFITKVIRLIMEQKAVLAVENISYEQTEDRYDDSIFAEQKRTSFDKAYRAKKHIRDYVFTDGIAEKSTERKFAEALDNAKEVCAYAKLPRKFSIPTPVGDYTPEWAIAFYEGSVKHMFFLAETKGTMESLALRPIEQAKIACARKLFNEMSAEDVVYHDVDSYQSLLDAMDSIPLSPHAKRRDLENEAENIDDR